VSIVPLEEVGDVDAALADAEPVPGMTRDTVLLRGYPLPFATTAASRAVDGRLVLLTLYSRDPALSADVIGTTAAAWASSGAELLG